MSTFTPGPWKLDGVEIYPVEEHPAYGAICELSPGQGDERFNANARLISAAPDLLEALEYAVLQVPELGSVPGIAAAIARARGQS